MSHSVMHDNNFLESLVIVCQTMSLRGEHSCVGKGRALVQTLAQVTVTRCCLTQDEASLLVGGGGGG